MVPSAPTSRRRFDRPFEGPMGGKNLFFGDSFVRLFGLVRHPDVDVHGFKGATAKGLNRIDNPNRQEILRTLKRRPNAERVILCFGNVDVHLSYYYKTYGTGEPIDLVGIAESYAKFAASLPVPPTAEVIVCGVYPPAPEDEHVVESLVCYKSVTEEQAPTVDPEDVTLASRRGRVEAFNRALAAGCRAGGVTYEDVTEEMIDARTGKVRDAFRDVSTHNIHFVWETTVLLWTRRWPWYRGLARPDFEEYLRRNLKDYLETKPWAEKAHIAEDIGVRAAVGGGGASRSDNNWRSHRLAPGGRVTSPQQSHESPWRKEPVTQEFGSHINKRREGRWDRLRLDGSSGNKSSTGRWERLRL